MSDTVESGLRARIASIVSNVVVDSSQGQCVVALLEELFNEELGCNANRWREIETAPKDGCDVLLFIGTTTRGYWNGLYKGWFSTNALLLAPTHWQPLPGPPREGE